MKTKSSIDYLKTILCLYRYDKDIEIEYYQPSFGSHCYDIVATNSVNGDVINITCADGWMMAVYEILDHIEQIKNDWENMIPVAEEDEKGEYVDEPPQLSFKWCNYSNDVIASNEKRNNVLEKDKLREQYLKEEREFFREVDEQLKNSMPCRNGTCEDREWTDMACVDNCLKHYHMSCQKLRDWHNNHEIRREKCKEWEEFIEKNHPEWKDIWK